jgi:hypothetical protein
MANRDRKARVHSITVMLAVPSVGLRTWIETVI